MFKPSSNDHEKTPVKRKGVSDVPADRKPPEKNSFWQSLALRRGSIQPKLTVSQPSDAAEREADHVADQVMRARAPQSSAPPAENAGTTAPQVVQDTINSTGKQLDSGTRSFMETRFNSDFSGVRVHTDQQAAASARTVDAHAYTVGNDIVFGEGQYSPGSSTGRNLLAHELTHVVQQQQAPAAPGMTLQRKAVAIRFQDEPTLDEVSDGKKVLQVGDKGEPVIRITTALAELGHYTISVIDENYDSFVKTAVTKYQDAKTLKGKAAAGKVDKVTFDELDKDFSASYKVERELIKKQKSADILKETQFVNPVERAASARAISTEVRVNPVTKKLPTFEKEIIGKGKYEDRLRKIVDAKIVAQYNRYGKGKAAEHTVKANLYDWKQIEVIAKQSQKAVDKVFAEYIKGRAIKPLEQGVNIFDAWDAKVKEFTAGGKKYEDEKVAWRVNKIFTGDEGVAALDEEHGAVQSRAAEKKIIDKIRTDMISKYRAELIETHKGWPGYEDEGKVYIQIFKGANDDIRKRDMWRYYQTFIHEYLHALEHPDHVKYREPMSEQKGDKTLREGVADYFTKIVWSSIAIDDGLREKIEGKTLYDPAKKTPIPPLHTYHESKNAERLAGILGVRNVAAAFFLGKVEYIGKK